MPSAPANFVQSNFLGGRWSPGASGRIELPEYRTSLNECRNAIPVEEGSVTRRSGTRDLGAVSAFGQIKEFWLPNNIAVVLEFTPELLRFWVPDATLGYRVLAQTFTTVYTSSGCQNLRVVQGDATAFVLAPGEPPYVLVCTNFDTASLTVDPTWTFDVAQYGQADGPYLDPLQGKSQTGNSLGSVDSNTEHVNFTITDGAYTFVSTDVGRALRLWSQPPAWNAATTYAEGDAVTYQGTYWRNLVGGSFSTGVVPGANTQPPSGSTIAPTQAWAITPTLGQWTYGPIQSITNGGTTANVLLFGPDIDTTTNGSVIDTWQLGVYTNNTFPTCGCYHEGRVWFGGLDGRLDSCMTNGIGVQNGSNLPLFSPTDRFGNVLDDSGISAKLNIQPLGAALWMEPTQGGIMIGTAVGELFMQASTLEDPITPTSIQVHRTTRYKGANAEPVTLGIAIAFIQALGRRVMEYVLDVFSRRPIGRHLNIYAKDLAAKGLRKLCYQEELAPIIWANTSDNVLIGCTYRRVSHFGTEGPVFMAWHRHNFGSGRSAQWICPATIANGTTDTIMVLTKDDSDLTFHMELMQPMLDVADPLTSAWFLDAAVCGGDGLTASILDNQVIISGLTSLNGATGVRVFLASLDCGLYTVTHDVIQVPFGSDPDGKLNASWLASQSGFTGFQAVTITSGTPVGNVPGPSYTVPLVVGYPFNSIITLQRPQTEQDVRSPTGPGLGKLRRLAQLAIQWAQTITGPQVSVDGGPAHTATFESYPNSGLLLDHSTFFNGIWWDSVDDDYGLDGQVTISRNDALPMTIAAVSGFLHTMDRG